MMTVVIKSDHRHRVIIVILVCAIWLVLSMSLSLFDRWSIAVCRYRPTRKPWSGRKTVRCRWLKFDTYRNFQRHHCDNTAFLSVLVMCCRQS